MTPDKLLVDPLPMTPLTDPGAAVRVIPMLPPETRLQLIRESVAQRNMAWLAALEEAGEFDFPAASEFEDRGAYSYRRFEISKIVAIADPVRKPNSSRYNVDVYTGDPLTGEVDFYLPTVEIDNSYFEFFQRRVRKFVEQSGGHDTYVKTFAESTAAVLMGFAAAINDSASIKALANLFPDAVRAHLKNMVSAEDEKMPARHSPAAVAIHFGSREALQTLYACGWRPSDISEDALGAPDLLTGSRSNLSRSQLNAIKYVTKRVESTSIFTFPSVVEWVVNCARSELKKLKKSAPDLDASTEDQFKIAAFEEDFERSQRKLGRLCMEQKTLGTLLPALRRCGVLDVEPTELAIIAAKSLNAPALDLVAPQIDWSAWSGLLTHQPRAPSAGKSWLDFPPVAFARAKSASGAIDDSDEFTAQLIQMCIDRGRGDLLAMSNHPDTPVRMMAVFGLPRSLLLCLEQGADPFVSGPDHSMSSADLARSNPACDSLIRSHVARKALLDAAAELTPVMPVQSFAAP